MDADLQQFPARGRCACGQVRYSMGREPMFVHCCHCSYCQRESGSAFALNALVESVNVAIEQGEVSRSQLPTSSGRGQTVVRCPGCGSVLWSHYNGIGDAVAFVRVGTLDNPHLCPPDIHIYTGTKQQWVQLDAGTPVVEEFYRRSATWPEGSVARYKQALQAG